MAWLERRRYGCCLSSTVTRNGHRRDNIRKGGYSGCVAMPAPRPANLQPIVTLLLSASSRASKLLERRLRYFWDADGAARLEIRAVFSFPATLQLLLAPFVSRTSLPPSVPKITRILTSYAFWTSIFIHRKVTRVHVHESTCLLYALCLDKLL